MKDKFILLFQVVLISALGFAVYSSSLNGKFIWDDEQLIEDNIYIKDPAYLPKIFTENIKAGAGRNTNFYRPVQMLTYMADYSLFGLDVKGYHLDSILWHVLTALCVFWLANIFYKDRILALLAGIFFAVHPIHTEAVAYISGRADSLSAFFMLFCFALYVKFIGRKSAAGPILIFLTYTFALLSKESSLILPALLLLYHYNFRERIKASRLFPILACAAVYILLRLTFFKFEAAVSPHPASFIQRVPGFFAAVASYLRLLILPFGQRMEYGYKQFYFSDSVVILGILITLAAAIYIWRRKDKKTLGFFGVCWFFMALAPVSNLYPINAYMAEHWLYIPSIGFFLILSGFLSSLAGRQHSRHFGLALIILLAGFYSYLTFKQNSYWRDPASFYERTLKHSNSARMSSNLANLYIDMGRIDEAIALHKKAVRQDPGYAPAYNNLANIYSSLGRNEEALALYKKAIELDPNFTDAYNNLGVLYYDLKEYDKAIEAYKKAMEISPIHMGAYANLGFLYYHTGRQEQAVAVLEQAVKAVSSADAYSNLGNIYKLTGKIEQAIKAYERAVGLRPKDAALISNLGFLYLDTGRLDDAVNLFQKAVKDSPGSAPAHNNLSIAYSLSGKYKQAISELKKALAIDPQPGGYYNLAVVYFKDKQYGLAVKYCDKALDMGFKVDPRFLEDLKPYR